MRGRLLLYCLLILASIQLRGQEDQSKPSKFQLSGKSVVRTMYTQNSGDLEDFYVSIAQANATLSYQATPWLKLSATGYGLTNFGLGGLKKLDATTGNGPIYEANLWNPIWLQGNGHFALPELRADMQFGQHRFTLGRFICNSPFINAEIWPFKNAVQGLAYVYDDPKRGIKVQTGIVNAISTRFDARYHSIGDSFGRGGLGVGVDGKRSRYFGNVDSDFVAMLGVDWELSKSLKLSVWNQYVDNVMNNILIEPQLSFLDGWSVSTMYLQQFKVNNGGNDKPELAYLPDDHAAYFGLRVNKKAGKNLIQLNFSRVLDQGRLQLTRDWGIEPFYTLQRRTRIEGTRNATVLMMKWQQFWKNDHGQFRWFSSVSRSWLPFAGDASSNKYRLPSYAHVDFAFKYAPKTFVRGLSAELYTAYRFLAADIGEDQRYLINRADFFHTDLILTYNF